MVACIFCFYGAYPNFHFSPSPTCQSWCRHWSTQISTSSVLSAHLVAILVDLEKSYEDTLRCGILYTHHSWCITCCLPLFLKEFFSSRSFKIILGKTYSEGHYLKWCPTVINFEYKSFCNCSQQHLFCGLRNILCGQFCNILFL